MAKIYVTLEVNAKDKLDACIAVKNAIENDKSIQLYQVMTEKPVHIDDACNYIKESLGLEIGEEEYKQWETEFKEAMNQLV